jgi:hypothetical protein
MTLSSFRKLSPRGQFLHVLAVGTYMALRWEGAGAGVVHLYSVPNGKLGFFAEVGIAALKDGIVVLRTFSDSQALTDYAHGVPLPGIKKASPVSGEAF